MEAAFNDAQAHSEGWGIFEMCPAFHADEPLQLEAVCNPELGPECFASDEDAVAFVIGKAAAGSAYHIQALRFLVSNSPRELMNFPSIASAIAA
jgi:hypothetical protein